MTNFRPTRMELRKTKSKYKIAQKGHKLLKDKTNQLVQIFYQKIKENKVLRSEVENELKNIYEDYLYSLASLNESQMEMILSLSPPNYSLNFGVNAFLGVETPKIEREKINSSLSLSPLSSNTIIDGAIYKLKNLFSKILELFELEKTTILLANEIDKCKRRVNALEHTLIPRYQSIISSIELKLSENELSNISKLKKVKKITKKV